jgi:hypothetical protein
MTKVNRISNFLFSVVVFGFYGVQVFLKWPLLKYWNIEIAGGLSDFQQTWRLQTCYFRTNPDMSFKCAENADPYIYGKIFGQFGKFKVFDAYISSIGYVTTFLSLLMLVLITTVVCKGNNLGLFYSTLIFLSPPMQLLIQRANLDLIIACAIFISLYLLKHNRVYWSFVVIAVISLIKFYPIFILGVYFIRHATFARSRILQVSSLTVFGLVIYEVSQVRENLPDPVWAGFGLKANLFWMSKIFQSDLFWVFVVTAGAILIFLISFDCRLIRKSCAKILKMEFDSDLVFLTFSVVFTFIFISVNSFDYRLIFLNCAFLFFIPNLSSQRDGKGWSLTISLLLLGANWLSFNSSNELQMVGDFLILVLSCVLLLATYARLTLKEVE